jgi:hypothetical protein
MACHLCNGKLSIVGQYFVADLITIGSRAESTIFLDLGGAEMLAWGPRPWGRRCGWHGVLEFFGIFWYRFFLYIESLSPLHARNLITIHNNTIQNVMQQKSVVVPKFGMCVQLNRSFRVSIVGLFVVMKRGLLPFLLRLVNHLKIFSFNQRVWLPVEGVHNIQLQSSIHLKQANIF